MTALATRPERARTEDLGAVEIARLLGQAHAPTDEQVRVIEAPVEPLLVVAGAGSGKTETMAARVVWLVANGVVRADEVLGLTFTRKAAGELADRIGARLRALRRALGGARAGIGDERPRIATYNAYAGALVRDHGLRIGLDPEARLLTEAGRWQLAYRVVETWPGELDVESAPRTVTHAVLQLAAGLAEHLRTPEEAAAELLALADAIEDKAPAPSGAARARPRARVSEVAASLRARARLMDVVAELGRRKRERSLLDFPDQVGLACDIVSRAPEVRRIERAQYRVVLLDEYQDTSVAQVRLLATLFGDGHPVTAVGDPHQAIYGWRGASAGAVERFPAQFPRVGADGAHSLAATATLSTSWRNDIAILGAANHVAAPLRARAAARSAGAADGGRVPLPVLRARAGAGPGSVRVVAAQTEVEEAEALADAVAAAWSPSPGDGRPATAAVLCRSRAQMPLVAEALRAAGLPVEVVGLGGLLSTPEVTDLHAALVVAHDPSRGDAAMRLLTGLRLGIADLGVLQDHARHLARTSTERGGARGGDPEAGAVARREPASIAEAIERPPAPGWRGRSGLAMTATGRARVRELGEILRAIRAQTHLPLPELVTEAERLLGLDIEVMARPDAEHARRHLDAFAEVAADFAHGTQAATLGAFLAWLDAADEYENGLETVDVESDPTAVQVLTVHAAKGLEWDVVAVPGLAEGAFPHYQATPVPRGVPAASAWLTALGELPYPLRGDAGDLPDLDVAAPADHAAMLGEVDEFRVRAGAHTLDEERRLAYVAFTRARRELVVSASWWKEGAKGPRPRSRFLDELVAAGAATAASGDLAAVEPEEPENPLAARRVTATWPVARPAERTDRLRRAAAAVVEAEAARGSSGPRVGDGEPAADGAWALLGPDASAQARGWARDADLLLAEQARRQRPDDGVALPPHLSASSVVRLVAEPEAFAVDRRRPVPREPSAGARRGTRFHAWVERHYASASLLDIAELPAADDELVGVDEDLGDLQRTFLASRWAGLVPVAIEADLETPVAGTTVRCRVDAVFALPGGGVEIVDWKTGSPSSGSATARQIQLALYRLAWSRLHGVPLDLVRAAFYYVAADVVVPAATMTEAQIEAVVAAQLADEAGLRLSGGAPPRGSPG